jgi:dUTP pyrophosphatase
MPKTFLVKVEGSENHHLYQNHLTYHEGDAGLDLFIIKDIAILPNTTKLVDLGIKCQSRSVSLNPIDWIRGKMYHYHSYYLFPRSSIAKTPLILKNSIGLIDRGYLGNIKAAFYNTSNQTFVLKRGERYVQLVNGDLSPAQFKVVDELRSTTRGEGGFGSTGA